MRGSTLVVIAGLVAFAATPLRAQSTEPAHPTAGGEHHTGGEHPGGRPHAEGQRPRRHRGGGEAAGTRRPGAEPERGRGRGQSGQGGPEDQAAAERRQRADSLGAAAPPAMLPDSTTADSTTP